jgi:protein O-mannosyl-transferase
MKQKRSTKPNARQKTIPAGPAAEGFVGKLVTGRRPLYLLIGLVLLLYFRTLNFDLVGLDDAQLIQSENGPTHTFAAVVSSFTQSSYVDFYRPGLMLFFYLVRLAGGDSLAFYHLCCVLLHALACCLTWIVLARLGMDRRLALLLSAFLAVHPLISQAVAWIMGCNDSLLTALVLGCFLLLMHTERATHSGFLTAAALHLILFAAALSVKETAVVLPALFLLYWWLLQDRRPPLRNGLLIAGGWALIAVAWFGLRIQALSHFPAEQRRYASSAGIDYLFQNLRAVPEMFGQLLVPFRLSAYPTFQDLLLSFGLAVLGLFVLLVLLTPKRNWRMIGFGSAWFLLFLAPTLVFRQQFADSGYDYLNHRLYVSIVGFLIVTAELHRAWVAHKGPSFRRVLDQGLLLVLVVLGIVNLAYTGTFKDRLSYWENAARTSPGSSRAHGTYAQALMRYSRDFRKAEPHLRTAVDLESEGPKHLAFMNNLAGIYSQSGKQNEAVALWQQILSTPQVFPGEENVPVQAGANLMLFYLQENKPAEARKYYEELKRRGVNVDAEFPEAASRLATIK